MDCVKYVILAHEKAIINYLTFSKSVALLINKQIMDCGAFFKDWCFNKIDSQSSIVDAQ